MTTSTAPSLAALNAAAAQLAENERTIAQGLLTALQGLSATLAGLQAQLPAYDTSVTGQAIVQLASVINGQITYVPQRIASLSTIIDAQTAAAAQTATATTSAS